MTGALAIDLALALLAAGLATWAVTARDAFAAVVGFVAYGLLVSIAWVSLRAVDVALTEAAIGSGLTGALLIGAVARLRRGTAGVAPSPIPLGAHAAGALAGLAVTIALAVAVLGMPAQGPSLAADAMAPLASTGLGNPVTATLMAYRATDTLLEKVVLVFALVGAWSLAADTAWGGRPGDAPRLDPDGLLAFAARRLPPIGVVVAIYLAWAAADGPGGAFPSATILAAMALLVVYAGLADLPAVSSGALRALLVAGAAVFLVAGLGGLAFGSAFLAFPPAWSKPIIVAIEIPMVVTVALTLVMLVAGAPARPR